MKKYLDLLKEHYEAMDQRTRLHWGVALSFFLLVVILFTTLNERISVLEKKNGKPGRMILSR